MESVRYELARRLGELFSLQELAYLLSESLQLDRIVTQVARYVIRFLDVKGSVVALTGDAGAPIRVAAADGSFATLAGRTLQPDEAGIIAKAIAEERLQVIEPNPREALPRVAGFEVQSAAAAPLRAHGTTVGALVVADHTGGPFRDEDLRLLSTVATHAAIVLANARFFDLIRAGKEQWETTFDALTEGIAVADENGRVRRANRALADLLQRPLPSVIGLDLSAEVVGDSPDVSTLFAAARAGAQRAGITIQSDRLGRLLRITAAPLRGAESDGWVVALVEDVTEQKALETQLIQNEKMVAVGQLVSGVAHELNNPLTSIAGLSEFLLEQGAPNEREREHLRVIQEQAERAGRIVRNLLTFARKGPADYGDVDFNDIVQRTIMLIGYELKLRDVQLEIRLSPNLPAVRGDRYELQQVVLNLVTNAVHAVADNPGEKPRRIVLSTGVSQGNQVFVRVEDNGPGIAPEHLSHIFSPFFTTKDEGQGTGLGLSISFGIVERHGGRLSVERSAGGAVFLMALPAATRDGGAAQGARASWPGTPQSEAGAEPPSPKDILLVDEDPAVQRMIRALFSRNGQRVEAPPDAEEAVRRLESRSFDLIIADPRAAVSAGESFATVLLKRWPELRSKTVLVTGDVRPEINEWLMGLGCSYLQKPFRIAELKAIASKIAGSQSS
ncbi:MAG: GAF domain-containing protein [Gemmatimonadetes bacterium]|nr:GAF domain-containing protein [Gemmatimonadota bacterium]